MRFMPGDTLDTWVVDRRLGRGGMGSVYLCHDATAPLIRAAVKVLEPGAVADQEARFAREAEVLAQLDHPAVVRFRGCRLVGEHPFLAMEWVEGIALDARLQQGPLPPEEALRHAAAVADALAYLHALGIAHRDIKPANLVIQPDGQIRLVDFGIAVVEGATRHTAAGFVLGTLPYLPPEATEDVAPDLPAWDLYALGVVLCECLSGRPAFPEGEGSASARQARVLRAKMTLPCVDPGAPVAEPLRAAVRAMTAADPKARPGDAAAVQALIAALRAGRVPASTAGLRPRPKPRGLAPWIAALGVGGAMALVLIALVAAVLLRPPADRPVDVVVTGLVAGTPVSARLGGGPLQPLAEMRGRFEGVAVGEVAVEAVAGEDCGEADCPGPGCSTCCSWTRQDARISAGEAAETLVLNLAPPSGLSARPVLLSTSGRDDLWVVTLELQRAGRMGEAAVRTMSGAASLRPGAYTVLAESGQCLPADRACGDHCPQGCFSAAMTLEVPCGEGLFSADLSLAPVRSPPLSYASPDFSPAHATELHLLLARLEAKKRTAWSEDPATLQAELEALTRDPLLAELDAFAARPEVGRELASGARYAAGVTLLGYAQILAAAAESGAAGQASTETLTQLAAGAKRDGLKRLDDNLAGARAGRWWCVWHGRSYTVLSEQDPKRWPPDGLEAEKARALRG